MTKIARRKYRRDGLRYASDLTHAEWALSEPHRKGSRTLEIIKRSDRANGLEIRPRRRIVEPTFAWLVRCRRLAKDFEATIATPPAPRITTGDRRITIRRAPLAKTHAIALRAGKALLDKQAAARTVRASSGWSDPAPFVPSPTFVHFSGCDRASFSR